MDENTFKFIPGRTFIPTGIRARIEMPDIFRCRLTGLLFETDKSFLLPRALAGLRSLKSIYDSHPGFQVLVVGHADSRGTESHNLELSRERAQSLADFLGDKAEEWIKWYGADKPASKRWGYREDQFMLSALDDGASPFYSGAVDGQNNAETQTSTLRFQGWSNANRGTSLEEDGMLGPKTRLELVRTYMARDGATLPEETVLKIHGCGEFHPDVPEADPRPEDEWHRLNRRVEVFLFEGIIHPKPQSQCPSPGCPEYPVWLARTTQTIDVDRPAQDPGILFLQLFDAAGVEKLAGRSYTISPKFEGGRSFSGTLDEDGKLLHQDVSADDYILSVDGFAETCAALVLDPDDDEPQIRFLEA